MELHQIRYFLAVAETLNFTRASERAYVSQPALTKGIQRLEEILGGRLFDRNSKAVQLTVLGQAMLAPLREIYDGALRAREQARSMARKKSERVRVGVMCTIAFDQMLPAFGPLIDEQGGSALQFREGTLEALTEQLDRGDIELGVLCSPYETPRRFQARRLFAEDYVLAIGDDHRFAGRGEVAVAELDREDYCERMACEYSQHIERLLDDRGVQVHVVQRSPREDWIQAFVRANVGVAFMPLSMAQAAELDFVRIADLPIVREVNLLAPVEREPSPTVQRIAELLAGFDWTQAFVTTPLAELRSA